jgi:hypothetical protein
MKVRLINYIFFITGLFIFGMYIWIRFIRERLPTNIPYETSLLGLFIIILIISTYIILLLSFYLNLVKENKLFIFINSIIYRFIQNVDKSLKNITALKFIHNKIIQVITEKNLFYNNDSKGRHIYIYILLKLLPRIVIILTLLIDIFYFHRIFLFYKIIIISIIPLLTNYILYSLTLTKEAYTKQLEAIADSISSEYQEIEDEFIESNYCYPVRKIIEEQTKSLVYDHKDLKPYPIVTEQYREEKMLIYKVSKNRNRQTILEALNLSKFINYEPKQLLKTIIKISIFIEEFKLCMESKFIIRIKIYLYKLYLACWSYIYLLNLSVQDLVEPFSITII